MNRVDCQPAYVLHRRPYRETSVLLELLTPEHGRLAVIAKGVRKARSASQGLLQSFNPLLVSWTGRGELKTLLMQELQGEPLRLQGAYLYAGFYLNELLLGLLQKWDAHPTLFEIYEESLRSLQSSQLLEQVLRVFEKRLLDELGYAPLSMIDTALAKHLQIDQHYRFILDQGFVRSDIDVNHEGSVNLFSGRNLLDIAQENWTNEEALRDAKRLHRMVISSLMGGKFLHSRKLFKMPEKKRGEYE